VNLFFEESGNFKAGTVLSRQGDAFQVELPGGRRAKVKSRDVLIEFEQPSPGELMQRAEDEAAQIELEFLWECAPTDEFTFGVLADDYFGAAQTPVQRAALVLRIHAAPIYFRRKGRGQYQRAPEDQLQAALAALEKRRQLALVQVGYEQELKAGRLPSVLADKALALLTRPDKNSIEYKALENAAASLGISMAQLMLDCGGIASARALHEASFLAEHFPHGTHFPPVQVHTPTDLPEAGVQAFSIDDVTTTEIDDALSVEFLADSRLRIGVHIAAPSLGIVPGDSVDLIARERLSTVYMPGDKITMMPDAVVDVFTLAEGGLRPAVSLYMIVNTGTYEVLATETRVERVFISKNLRHNELEDVVTEASLAEAHAGTGDESEYRDYPHQREISALWPLAQALYEKRQLARLGYGLRRETQRHTDFNFYVEGEHITISPRRRGSPLDTIVAEMAIMANSAWGAVLAEHGVPGIYRAQRAFGPNRTRMQTTPAPHEGLGVTQYAWSTSPLRRYVDLVNQWQLVACVQHGVAAKLVAPFKPKDADLFAVVQGFDDTYSAYADHQRRMEHFWCLRWLKQEHRKQVVVSVVKGDVVRLDEVPLLLTVAGLGVHARGTKLLLEVMAIDELRVEASCRLLQVLDDAPAAGSEEAANDDGADGTIEHGDAGAVEGGEGVEGAASGEGDASGESGEGNQPGFADDVTENAVDVAESTATNGSDGSGGSKDNGSETDAASGSIDSGPAHGVGGPAGSPVDGDHLDSAAGPASPRFIQA
jgi:exoribonuclease-2